VWIPSHLWFTFQRRRVIEISAFQKRLCQLEDRPPNYGLITSILSYMLQHVGITPIIKDHDVIEALADLHFNAISRRFGCFFLHNLDLSSGQLPDIQEEDSETLIWMLKGNKVTANTQPKGQTGNPADQPSFRSLTWKQLCDSLNTQKNPRTTIKPFIWDHSWLMFSVAEAIFCAFTTQWWLFQTDGGFTPMERAPFTLREAMDLWTLDSVKARGVYGIEYNLVPSADELNGDIPEKSRQYLFELLRVQFFPEPGTRCNPSSPQWRTFFQTGYVRRYHRAIKVSRDGGKSLKDALDRIFMNLQLLPYNPGQPDTTACVWCWKHSVITLLINSSYIQMLDRTIKQAAVEVKGPGYKKVYSGAYVEKLIRGNEVVASMLKKPLAERSTRSKNWRLPPHLRKQQQAPQPENVAGDDAVDATSEFGRGDRTCTGQSDREDDVSMDHVY